MRTSSFFLWGRAVLIALAVAGFFFTIYAPGYGDTGRSILLAGLAMFPAVLAAAFLVVGVSARVLGRATDAGPQGG
jgi:hypothetical protein